MEFGRCGRREMGKDRGRREKQCVNKNEGVTAEALESCGRGFHHQKIKMQRLQLEVSLQQREILTRFSVSLSFF